MATYKLEGGIPINKVVRHKKGPSKHFDYEFDKMDFGENNTFLINMISSNFELLPGQKKTLAKKQASRVTHQARRYRRNFHPGFKVETRARNFKEHREVGVRVWRTA